MLLPDVSLCISIRGERTGGVEMGEVEKTERVEVEIMTTSEVAQYLRLAEATIYRLAQAGEIPAMKVGRVWRFRKDLIDEWFRQGSGSLSGREFTES